MVNVFNDDRIVGRVNYNSKLDHWDGNNYTCGSTGRHLGITQLQNGSMVLIHGTQWQGEKDRGEVVTDDEAIQAILKNNPNELENWPHLKKLFEENIQSEINA